MQYDTINAVYTFISASDFGEICFMLVPQPPMGISHVALQVVGDGTQYLHTGPKEIGHTFIDTLFVNEMLLFNLKG